MAADRCAALLELAKYIAHEHKEAVSMRDDHQPYSRMWDHWNGRTAGFQMVMMELERLVVGRPSDYHDKALPAICRALAAEEKRRCEDDYRIRD